MLLTTSVMKKRKKVQSMCLKSQWMTKPIFVPLTVLVCAGLETKKFFRKDVYDRGARPTHFLGGKKLNTKQTQKLSTKQTRTQRNISFVQFARFI